MSLTDVAIEQFRDQFINVYQTIKRQLNGTVMEVRGVTGTSYNFALAGKVILHDRGAFHSDIPSSQVDYNRKVVVFQNKICKIPSDIFEQAEVNASERQNLAKTSAYAISRWEDQFIINALDSSGSTPIPDGNTGLSLDKLLAMKFKMDENNIPPEGRHFGGHARQLQDLLAEQEITSYDYNTIRALVRGEVDTFLGFKFHFFGNMDEGGIPITGDIRTCFAWHEDAVGMAYSIEPSVSVDWVPTMQSYIVIPRIRAGAVALQDEGIVKVNCDENPT